MKRRLFLGALSASIVGGGAYVLTRPEDGVLADPFMAANAQASEADISAVTDMVLGAEDAPITIVEYASFTCPHCASFHANQYPQLKANYIDTGKVRFVYREVFFDRPGLWASMMARCGDTARFFGIADMLYARQRDWTNGDGAAVANNLRRIGISAGLDEAAVDACMRDADMAQNLVGWYQANVEADDVQSTPTLIIDDVKYGNMAYAELAAILDEKLGA